MSDFPYQITQDVSHRPWPLPGGGWVMTQSWHDLLFAHWPVDERALREKLPAGLPLDTFDGQAWVGIVPFRMTNVAPRGARVTIDLPAATAQGAGASAPQRHHAV